jgi:hypothetical protein
MKIIRNSKASVTRWKTTWYGEILTGQAQYVKSGIVKDAVGDTIKIEYTAFKLWILRIWYSKWYSFNDKHYKINVQEAVD